MAWAKKPIHAYDFQSQARVDFYNRLHTFDDILYV